MTDALLYMTVYDSDFQPKGWPPPRGHRINMGGHDVINVVEKMTKQIPAAQLFVYIF